MRKIYLVKTLLLLLMMFSIITSSINAQEEPIYDKHIIDKYNWVDSCKGYMSLGDFEKIIKYEIAEDVIYAK